MGKAVKPIKDIKKEIMFLEHVSIYEPRIELYWSIARAGAYRSTEVLKLKVEDIKRVLKKGYFDFLEKKTGKYRCPYINRDMRRKLEEVISGKADHEYIIQSKRGFNQPLCYRQMQDLIVEYGKRCCLYDIGTHTPRKTSAYHLFIETGDIERVMKYLNHRSRSATYAYIDCTEAEKQEEAQLINYPYAKKYA